MSLDHYKELTPVLYNTNGLKILNSKCAQPGNMCFGMHWHERMELNLVSEGSMMCRVGNQEKVIYAGQIAIISPEQLHYAEAGPDGASYYTIMFDLGYFQNELPATKKILPPLKEKRMVLLPWTDHPEIVSVYQSILELHRSNDLGDGLMAIGKVYELIALMYRFCLVEENAHSVTNDRFRDVLAYVNNHFYEDISSDWLSRKFGYSLGYFSRHFKEITGLSPMIYIRILRLEKATQMLQEQKLSIGKIAEQCGFGDISYFTKCFKQQFGVTPTEFITRH